MPLLAEALKTQDLQLELTGFTPLDIQLEFTDSELATLFVPNASTEAILDELKGVQADAQGSGRSGRKRSSGAASADGSQNLSGDSPPTPAPTVAEQAKAFRAKLKDRVAAEDTETFAVVFFGTREEREAFVIAAGGYHGAESRYLDGPTVMAKITQNAAPPAAPAARKRAAK